MTSTNLDTPSPFEFPSAVPKTTPSKGPRPPKPSYSRLRKQSGKARLTNAAYSFICSVCLGNIERLGAVPTGCIKPSPDSSFTTYTFSTDGATLATGETNGSISLWSMDTYELLASISPQPGCPISCLSFFMGKNDRLITIDKEGYVRHIQCRKQQSSSQSQHKVSIELLSISNPKLEQDEVSIACFDSLTDQFSKDGRILAHCRRLHASEDDQRVTHVELHQFDESGIRSDQMIQVECDEFYFSIPVLSKNGRSLLICSSYKRQFTTPSGIDQERFRAEIKVLPSLDFSKDQQTEASLGGERAFWGLNGDYLLVWRSVARIPSISLYPTSSLINDAEEYEPIAETTLRSGLQAWNARMVKNEGDGGFLVLICEVSSSSCRRFVVWETKKNNITEEVMMNMSRCPAVDRTQYLSSQQLTKSMREYNLFPSTRELCQFVNGDVFPSFCASRDGKWIGAFSSANQSGAIASTKKGVTPWTFHLPHDCEMDAAVLPNEVMFDGTEEHFVVFGNNGIFVFKIPFLQERVQDPVQGTNVCEILDADNSTPNRQSLVAAHHTLPGLCLAKTWGIGTNSTYHLRLIRSGNDPPDGLTYIDASLSEDGQFMAVIARGPQGESLVKLFKSGSEWAPQDSGFTELHFTGHNTARSKFSNPTRVFLAKTGQSSEETIILFSCPQLPFALFCDISSARERFVDLETSMCLDVSLSENRQHITILDSDRVLILSMKDQAVVDAVAYRVPFDKMLSMVKNSVRWKREEHSQRWGRKPDKCSESSTERRIADDGRLVLMAWDTKNDRSIIVNPDMEQGECAQLIKNANGSLSDCCVLSAGGECTLFIDVNRLNSTNSRKITVGIFNESVRQVKHRFNIAENLPADLPEEIVNARLLPNVFYGISKDREKIVTATTRLSRLPGKPSIKDYVRTFTVFAATDGIPNYDQMSMKPLKSVKENMYRLYEDKGICASEVPSADGKSTFQRAFMNLSKSRVSFKKKNTEIVNCTVELAQQHGFEVAFNWTDENNKESGDLLAAALEARSTKEIQRALDLVCKEVVSFNHGAAALKKSFRRLVSDIRNILEEALKNNRLVTEACQLKVHVDFLNPSLRRSRAVHIDTSDSFNKWTDLDDEDARATNWKTENQTIVNDMEKQNNKSTELATLKFVKIEDAAKTGMNGIIRPLLLQGVPEDFFQFDAVKWIVMYKWMKIWRKRFMKEARIYALFLVVYVTYVVYVSASAELSTESVFKRILASGILFVLDLFGIRMGIEEYRQIRSCVKDGEECLQSKRKGLWYYFQFMWNWLDLLSFALLTFITVLHILAVCSALTPLTDISLSVLVAFESLVASAKVWYYAQPFRRSGPLVQMINHIVLDCRIFLGLATVVLFGFSLALHILFRHTPEGSTEGDMVEDAFGRFDTSLLTLFYALLGDFEQEVYRSARKMSGLVIFMFVAYMFTQMIVLLNLLISIMGDTFDRVRDTEEAQLLIGRAQFIDASEAALSEKERDEIDNQIHKYLHVLVSANSEIEADASTQWTGKLNRIERSIREAVKGSEQRIENMFDERSKETLEKDREIQALNERLADSHERLHQANQSILSLKSVAHAQDEDLTTLKQGMHEMKETVSEMKASVSTLQADMLLIKQSTTELHAKLDTLLSRP